MVLIISLIIRTLIYLLPTLFVEFDIVMVITPHVKILSHICHVYSITLSFPLLYIQCRALRQ